MRRIFVIVFFLCIFPSTPSQANSDFLFRAGFITGLATFYFANPLNADAIGFDNGYSVDGRDLYFGRITTRWTLNEDLVKINSYHLDTFLYFGLAQWRLGLFSEEGAGLSRVETVNNVIEVISAYRHQFGNFPVYIETNLGIAYFSSLQLGDVEYGSHGQFVSGWTIGYDLPKTGINFLLKFQHYSDNDFTDKNPGENFLSLTIENRFN